MSVDWQAWYEEALDGLVQTIEGSTVDWAEDPEGNPWIVVGDRERTGLEFPAAFIPAFSKSRDTTDSDSDSEWLTIEARILVLQKGDPKEPQANLRSALKLLSQVENAVYDNRTLQGTCKEATVTGSTPFAGVGQEANLEGGEIELDIRKPAETHA